MGTRSVTYFFDDNKFLVGLYRQMDGYPTGHGKDLAEFLKPITIVNGLSSNRKNIANGIQCLAAQVIAHFKVEPGYFYIVPKGDNGQEYEYHIHCKEHVIYVKVYHNSNKKKLFEGNVIEFYD